MNGISYLEVALLAMETRAMELLKRMRGVGGILIRPPTGMPTAYFFFLGEIVRQPDPANRGQGDRGTNYFGIAMSKAAFSLATHQDSGVPTVLRYGEVEYRGSIFLPLPDGVEVVFFFSGGTEDEDVEIAKAGLMKIACNRCKGKGQIIRKTDEVRGSMVKCPNCGGLGINTF
ncbi:MAG TPA: hypothetical protein VJ227_04215 [Patescibacteria group bacterium]|nr:hypothetical protein [Patescibacteria group bacterium]